MSDERSTVEGKVQAQPAPTSGEASGPDTGADHRGERSPRLQRVPISVARALLVVVGLLLLEVAVRMGLINEFFMPPPSEFLVQVGRDLASGEFLIAAGATLLTTAAAFALAGVMGVALGFLFWRAKRLGEAYEPLVAGLFSSPIIILFPIAAVLFGRNAVAAIALAAIFGVLPIVLYTSQALSGVSPILLKVGSSLNLSTAGNFRHILLPAAAPTIFTGLRIGMTYILKVVVTMEFVLRIGGMGSLVSESSLQFRAAELYSGVTLIVLMSVAFIYMTYQVERVVK